MKIIAPLLFLFAFTTGYCQTVTLPVSFESGSVVNGDFTNFDGGTATVIANPQSSGINTSSTVGQMVRNGGQVWAGAYLTTPSNVNFGTDPVICMKVYTTAPIGTNVSFKMEGCGGGCFRELSTTTNVSGAWETLCWDFTGEPTSYNRMVLLFDLGNTGDGTSTSTFLFDDIEQLAVMPLPFTSDSRYFCPNATVALTFTGGVGGPYNWYADETGGSILAGGAGTAFYETPLLTEQEDFYVEDLSVPQTSVTGMKGPSCAGGEAFGNASTTSQFFTSNMVDGAGLDAILCRTVIPAGAPPGGCTYQAQAFNLTQGVSRIQTNAAGMYTNHTDQIFNFSTSSTSLPMDNGDQIEVLFTASPAGCYVNIGATCHYPTYLPYPSTTAGGELTFTAAEYNGGAAGNNMTGLQFWVNGRMATTGRTQINALEDCGVPLPVEMLEFAVKLSNGAAVLNWRTGSELNNDYFEVQRSTDQESFETIGIVQGSGTTSRPIDYTFTDAEPLSGPSYYRLNQVDYDGASELSRSVALTVAQQGDLQLFPNPTSGILNIAGTFETDQPVQIEIIDVLGTKLLLEKESATQGPFEKAIDISHFPPGAYTVKVNSLKNSQVLKLIKR